MRKVANQMIAVIITAAGNSLRMCGEKKEFLPLENGTMLSETAKKFLSAIHIGKTVITHPAGTLEKARAALFADDEIVALAKKTELLFVVGGGTRQESVRNALELLAQDKTIPDIVLVHDGARPFVSKTIITNVVDATKKFDAAVPCITPVDTLKKLRADGFIQQHLTRSDIASVQTPQGFKFVELLEAHRKASTDGKTYTDDSEIWGTYCGDVKIVTGDVANKKITYPADMPLSNVMNIDATAQLQMQTFRIGLGYDVHRMASGRKLVVGGVTIPFDKGEEGHSDGDALLHAVTDAILGASGLGDIGSFFPPSDNKWLDANSLELLQIAWEAAKKEKWQLVNIDCVVKLEAPKLLPYRKQICTNIAHILETQDSAVFVKAKTAEKLGDVGTGNAIEAWATCILSQQGK